MRTVVVLLLVLMSTGLRSQVDSVLFTERGNHQYSFFYSAFTSVFDRLDRPYVYSASMELGIVCFDVSDLDNPMPVDTLPTSALGNLNATNLWIESNRLYASLGGFQGIAQNPGLAIIDLDDPENLEILG
ncbi:MAG: hypothetical protein KDC12_16090, partial [Flavobacteriales bacterium]|nr:hypothetical protein [Flavobacteriales bacterium]